MMSIINEYGQIHIVCDTCDVEVTDSFDHGEFHEMIAAAKRNGWLAFKEPASNLWHHTCPGCKSGAPSSFRESER